MDPWLVFAAVGLIAFFAGFVHSAVGFGFGIVAISLIPFVMDAKSAHVVVSISSVPMLCMAAWAYRGGIEWISLRQSLLGAAIFLPLGYVLFETVSLDLLVRGTGLAIIAMVFQSLRNQDQDVAQDTSKGSCFVAGAAAGFLAGAVSIAGPPIAAFALKQDWSPLRYKSFVTQCLLVIAVYKAVFLAASNRLIGDVIGQSIVAAIVSIVGVQLGAMISSRIPASKFKRLVAVSLILVACMMLWRGQPESTSSDASPSSVETVSLSGDANFRGVRGSQKTQ